MVVFNGANMKLESESLGTLYIIATDQKLLENLQYFEKKLISLLLFFPPLTKLILNAIHRACSSKFPRH